MSEELVRIIMGSKTDLPIMQKAAEVLDELKIKYEMNVASAHRTPEKATKLAKSAIDKGIKVIIAGAGGAAHLPGVLASFTTLPVIGVPVNSSISMNGLDSLLSIAQMPPGIPVATVGVDGARNAGILAAQILATAQIEIEEKLIEFKKKMSDKIEKDDQSIQ